MRMADVLPKPRHGNLRILLAPYKGIVRVPKQGHLRRVSLLQNIEQRGRTDKIAVGFEQHSNILRAGIVAELTQGLCHSRNDFIRRSHDLVSHDPYVRGSQLRSQVDKPPAVDRKSTRLNSSHQIISYAVFCLKKKTRQKPEAYINCITFTVALRNLQNVSVLCARASMTITQRLMCKFISLSREPALSVG